MISLTRNTPGRSVLPKRPPVRLTPHHHSAWRRFTVLGQNTEAIAYSMHLEEAAVVRLLGEVREVRRATENQLGRS